MSLSTRPSHAPLATTRRGGVPIRRWVAALAATVTLTALTAGAPPSSAGPTPTVPLPVGVAGDAPTSLAERPARGWVLAPVASVHGDRVNTIYGQRCRASRFGRYEMVAGLTDRGRQSSWTFGLKVTRNGARHGATGLTFTSYTPAKVRKQVRRIFARTTFRYLARSGSPYLQGVARDGSQQSLIPFRTRRGACR